MRLKVKLAQLGRLRDLCAGLRAGPGTGRPASPDGPTIELMESLLTLAAEQVERQIEASTPDETDGTDSPRHAAAFARRLVEGREHALTDAARQIGRAHV